MRMPTGEHTGEYIETNSIFLEYQKQLFLPDWADIILWYLDRMDSSPSREGYAWRFLRSIATLFVEYSE
jgi:hypothetical protein